MANFNRDNSSRGGYRGGFGRDRGSFGGRNFGGRENYDRGDRGPRQMFKTVCSNCGRDCEVPFKPTGDKPVYCSDCFEKLGKRDERRSFDKPRFNDRSSSDEKYKAQLESVNAKLDEILNLLKPKEVILPVEPATDVPDKKTRPKSSKSKKSPKEKATEAKE